MSPVTPHPSTAVAHEILDHYLAEWAEAVARGLRGARPAEEGEEEPAPVRVVYADGFCNSGGRHSLVGPGRAAAGAGSALRGVRALERLAARAPGARAGLHATAVLVEEDPAEVDRLERTLDAAGLGARVRRTDDPAGLAAGEVGLVQAGLAEAAEGVGRALAAADHALCFLAPPAAGKLPLAVVRSLAARGADLLVAFPHAELLKQARWRGSTLADLPSHARQQVDGYSALFGDARYEWLPLWREAERAGGAGEAEARMVERYAARLAEIPGRTLKRLPVHLSDEPADSLYLFLLAADPAGALWLNRAVREAGVADRADLDRAFRAEEAPAEEAVLELFAPEEGGDGPLAPPGERPADTARLARTLVERFRGRTVPYGEVLRGLADTDLTGDEVRRAMAALKRTGEAAYRSLSGPAAEVEFPEVPVVPARRRAARARPADLPLLAGLETDPAE
ncbi:MAG TPA: hypothetical protein VF263_15920 [Longimicrobiaceae bacterium]